MYIAPNSVIRVLHNCPLDNTYNHTIYFATEAAQSSYFIGLTKYSFNNQTYQRVQRNAMRVARKADDLYDCNYVMFQNTGYGNKWFYAFITGVEYINNETSEITFEIDVMQTWHFDYNLGECFVEREHTVTDYLYEHTIEEDVDCGEDYIIRGYNEIDLSNMEVCVLSTTNADGERAQGRTINGVYTGLNITAGISATDATSLNLVIGAIIEAAGEQAIVAIYQYPASFGDASTTSPHIETHTIQQNTNSFYSYTPKNKKLFSYPFTALKVSNNAGQSAIFKWELWGTGTATFELAGVFVTEPSALCYPTNYGGTDKDYDSGIALSDFPQCGWAGDAFKTWWAQNKFSAVNSLLATVQGSFNGVLNSGPKPHQLHNAAVYGAGSIMDAVFGTVAKIRDLKSTAPQAHGQIMCDSLNTGIDRTGYRFYRLEIKDEYARVIDNYFTMFGYACHRVKTPNRSARPYWTYTKTNGCVVTGSVPADDMRKICGIYDAGVTFWTSGAVVGNYSLDNSPS